MPRQYYAISLIAIVVFGLDRISKIIVMQYIHLDEICSIMPLFNIVFVTNTGVSFGILSGIKHGAAILSIITLFIIIGIIIYAFCIKSIYEKCCLTSIIAGAIGNLTDRFLYGGVTDFLDFYVIISQNQYHWPAFNIADSAIFCGVATLLLRQIFNKQSGR